ncbi:MAG: phytanoyl-CoA dioxygenase family protein [Pseudomonadota bacterium]
MGNVLSAEQVAQFHRDGFLSPITVMTLEEAAALRAELEAAETAWPEAFSATNRSNAHLVLNCLDRLVHHPLIVQAVSDILGPDLIAYGTVLFIKEAQDPGFISWHQDATYMGLSQHRGVSSWIALSPSTRGSGCMRMIPGSHARAIVPHTDTFGESNILTRGQTIEGVDESQAVDLILAPGQMSLHNLEVMHASHPNSTDDRRIGFTTQCYLPPDVRQVNHRCIAQLARGEDRHGHFELAPRPVRDMEPEGIATRDRINAIWSDILYDGAAQRRAF